MEVARIAAYSRLLEQVGWDSPAREAAVVADAEPLAQVLAARSWTPATKSTGSASRSRSTGRP